MHGADGQGDGGRRGEDELELTGNLDDEELAKGGNVEETQEGADKGNGEDGADVVLGSVALAHGIKAVHGGNTGDEDTRNTTSTGSSGLDDGVFLGTENTTDDGNPPGPRHHLDDTVTENSTEHVGAEGETGLETCMTMVGLEECFLKDTGTSQLERVTLTKIEVGSADKTAQNDTDDKGTDGQGVLLVGDGIAHLEGSVKILLLDLSSALDLNRHLLLDIVGILVGGGALGERAYVRRRSVERLLFLHVGHVVLFGGEE